MAIVAGRGASDKFDVMQWLGSAEVEELCQELQHHWRQGKLGPARTVELFAWQVQMGNVSCDAVHHHANGDFTAEAYCMARQRLPRELLQELSRRIATLVLKRARRGNEHRWLGLSVYRIDGTGLQLPDDPQVRKHFGCSGKQKRGCGYPTMHVLLLTGPGGAALDAIGSPLRTGDVAHAAQMHRHLQPGDVLLGDVLFAGWGHLMHLISQCLNGVFPAHHSRTIGWGRNARHGPNRRFVKTLGYQDQLVEYRKPQRRPPWMSAKEFKQAPEWLRVREIKRMVKVGGVRREVTVVTTLLDPVKYPAKKVVSLLAERWLIETQLRSLKTTMGMERLRCRSVDGVMKELLMYLIVYNLLRLLILQAAEKQQVKAECVSLASALARLRYGTMPMWVNLALVPYRPDRQEPRVVKQRTKAFARMTRPRAVLRTKLRKRPINASGLA